MATSTAPQAPCPSMSHIIRDQTFELNIHNLHRSASEPHKLLHGSAISGASASTARATRAARPGPTSRRRCRGAAGTRPSASTRPAWCQRSSEANKAFSPGGDHGFQGFQASLIIIILIIDLHIGWKMLEDQIPNQPVSS